MASTTATYTPVPQRNNDKGLQSPESPTSVLAFPTLDSPPSTSPTIDVFTEFKPELLKREYVDQKPFVLRGVASQWDVMKWNYDSIRQQCADTKIWAYHFNRKSKAMSYIMQAVFSRRLMTIEQFFANHFQKGTDGSMWSIKECADIFEQHPELLHAVNFEDIYLGPDVPRKTYFWIGNPDSSIGLHCDITQWNTLLQVHGKKHWKFYHPSDKQYLYMETKGAVDGGMYSPLDVFSPVDLEQYPLYAKATCYDLILQPGDILYVPSGWWHAVYSMTSTMSVNYIAETCNYTATGYGSMWWVNDMMEGIRLLALCAWRIVAVWILYLLDSVKSSSKKSWPLNKRL